MPPALPDDPAGWQQCQNLADDAARLACYDRWAGRQMPPAATPSISPAAAAGSGTPSIDQNAARIAVDDGNDDDAGCHDRRYSVLSRFWELEKGSDCGTFGLRSYRPLGIAFSIANRQPETAASPSPGHTETPQDYRRGEMRINLSLRTKLAQNLFTRDTPGRKDSLWFGYTQQSTWQVFTNGLSRPFRTTDHEPELMYVYPVDMPLSDGWRWRYAGLGISHQSNGQALPLSRSWNRVYLMGGIELDDRWRLTARAWQRIPESEANDDNPDIVRYIGRAELAGWWTPSAKNSYGVTWRAFGRGSVRLEWLRALGHPENSNLRLHAQLFHGYGDTLLDYNRRRTIFSVGLSLVDF
ncbi:MAG: phospholipase A [Zoogloeaceae bacterium]|nr:phospholipase A [Zoogloeaceae bacterium]